MKLSNLSVIDVTDNGTHATVTLDNGGEIIFRNLLADDISAADFLFVGSGGFLA